MLSEDSKRYPAFDTTILTPWRKGSQPCFQDLLHLSKDSLPVHIKKSWYVPNTPLGGKCSTILGDEGHGMKQSVLQVAPDTGTVDAIGSCHQCSSACP